MELIKLSNQERLKLCRRYFYIGFFGVPFLWVVNTIWFGMFIINYDSYQKEREDQLREIRNRINRRNQQNEIVRQRQSNQSSSGDSTQPQQTTPNTNPNPESNRSDDENKSHLRQIRNLVIFSAIGSLLWIIGLTIWIVIYQLKRVEWGEWGDEISFNIPRGIP
ncbi:hypothetical protein NH340_JMT05182 [Sarcoptes scabiei]|uniref:Gamma-secretase subunit PEN-2 n=1 Tax=Sarcoptes scabiei TaxID=52283 RepID=A0A131ZZ83_SARSC|nr:gamma-secretase subunit PEN-2-like protein [Sarcoptes scabiei]UXI19239.1 hypothetical protein NH340_JMT05182 [Sarcoptes scabiei]